MSVDTAKVSGRRKIHYDHLDAIVADAEALARDGYRPLGNWTLGQISQHLSSAMLMAVDGAPTMAPWPVRFLARTLFKNQAIKGPLKPGFKLPAKARPVLLPNPTEDDAGLATLRTAVERTKQGPLVHPHPFFGPMSPQEWLALDLRHAELHMSFLVPKAQA